MKKFFSKKKKPTSNQLPQNPPQKNLRLNKFMAHCGIDNRRACELFIKKGLVTVNDNVVTDSAYRVQEDDVIKYEGKVLQLEKQYLYILLNKPKNYHPTLEAIEGEKTFKNIFGNKIQTPIQPILNLKKQSVGLMLFSDDNVLVEKLSQPTQQLKVIYHLVLGKAISEEGLHKVQSEITSKSINISSCSHVQGKGKEEIGIEAKGLSDELVINFFEELGYPVEKLDRVFLAGLTKKDLSRGRFRVLSEKEAIFLKHFS